MTNFRAVFFTWQWLTKYIFSSIYKIPNLQNKIVYSLTYFEPFFFFLQTYSSNIKKEKKKKHVAKSVCNFFGNLFPKFTIFRDG